MKPAVTHTYVDNDCDCPDDCVLTLFGPDDEVIEMVTLPWTAAGRDEAVSRVIESDAVRYTTTCAGCGQVYIETEGTLSEVDPH